jgi:hypothetical protein
MGRKRGLRSRGTGKEPQMKLESELMRGAGPAPVLQLLAGGEVYGYQIVEALTVRSKGVLEMEQSTLYPMLYTSRPRVWWSPTTIRDPTAGNVAITD